MMKEAVTEPNVIQACTVDGREASLSAMKKGLDKCQKSLNEYLDVKKAIFPRFYFVSAVALLDMLANGTNPRKIMPYLGDCYDALANLLFIKMHEEFSMEGEVEVYLNKLTAAMQLTLRNQLLRGIEDGVNWDVDPNLPRHKWCFKYPAQVVLTGSLIYWTEETEQSLEELEAGKEDAVKIVSQNVKDRLSKLILLVLGELTGEERCKTITLITMDVHGRDVLQSLIDTKTEGPSAFLWQQQLRFYWEHDVMDVNIKICDFRTKYFYEWTGNVGRLVITALTDRCYITLTMGLRLFLGGAPAGRAARARRRRRRISRALALPCYVFNCSDQMNYQSMADIFRGLAQTGAWGCFDEFNRISIEVLSVVATQVKTVQDAIVKFAVPSRRDAEYQNLAAGTPPQKVGKFDFFGTIIDLIPTCGFYITMNPGYAGRTELPENLKALFRSCAMIRPDLKPICENMLMSEGFQSAQTPRSSSSPALDTPIFLRLIADLFMGLEVPVKVDETLKADDVFILKTCQFQELLDVRHSVMLLGPAGCGKTTIWKTLMGTHNLEKPKKTCVYEAVNPKAVSGDELYGYMTLSKDWKDGVLSIIMRGMAKNFQDQGFYDYQTYKWVVLDGDIDAVWIESMNTVMDDNKLDAVAAGELTPEKMEAVFVFCHVWAFGGAMVIDKQTDFRKRFSDEFLAQFPAVRYPKEGDVLIITSTPRRTRTSTGATRSKSTRRSPSARAGETPFMALNVETVDSKRTKYLIDVLARGAHNVMLVGTAGTGKTATIDKYLSGLDKDADGILSYNIVMSYYTDSAKLQVDLELPIDKRAGRMFGPPATKRLIYFIDDLNLPYLETYGTQNSIALLTQQMQHGTIFDRADLGFRKEIVDVQFITAMNPTAGSFEICERCQIHFATFSCSMPSTDDLQTIYEQIFSGHLSSFESGAAGSSAAIVTAAIKFVDKVATKFLPTSIRFTYFWTMREMSNIFQNVCLAKPQYYGTATDVTKLWAHECRRVMSDRLVTTEEVQVMNDMIAEVFKGELKALGVAEDVLLEEPVPCIFTTFTAKEPDGAYRPIESMEQLKHVLDAKLIEYNESNAMMDLVLFDDAMRHISRIARIIANPAGNAMLIGVGGSGKQSLSKLAAFICGYETRQLAVTGAYSVADLKEDIKNFYTLACAKDTPTVFY
ncbi:dynein light chain binding protein [Aureococcus anophagefferens]|nr:dynein light chain binding protein [Aureococcus anophagefferens]